MKGFNESLYIKLYINYFTGHVTELQILLSWAKQGNKILGQLKTLKYFKLSEIIFLLPCQIKTKKYIVRIYSIHQYIKFLVIFYVTQWIWYNGA